MKLYVTEQDYLKRKKNSKILVVPDKFLYEKKKSPKFLPTQPLFKTLHASISNNQFINHSFYPKKMKTWESIIFNQEQGN